MGKAEDAAREQEMARQQASQRDQEKLDRECKAKHSELIRAIRAEIPRALARLERKGFPGAKLEREYRDRHFWERRGYSERRLISERAYWELYVGEYTASRYGGVHGDSDHKIYAKLFSDGELIVDTSSHGWWDVSTTYEHAGTHTLLENLKKLGT